VPTRSQSSSRGRIAVRPRERAAGTAAPAVTSDVHAALAELLAYGDRGWVVSCYQKLEPKDRAGEKYRIKLKNRLRLAGERARVLGFAHQEREAVQDALARIEEFFRHRANLAGSRGMAVFAGRDFFRAVHLPHVLKSRVLVDRSPVVGELVALAEAGSKLLVAVADRRSARLFAVDLAGVQELDGLFAPDATRNHRFHPERGAAPGVGEFRFHSRISEEKHRHLAHVAEAIEHAVRGRAFNGVVVGGIGVDAGALLPHLHAPVRDAVIGVLRLNPKEATPADIRARAMELWAESADAAAADTLGELEGLVDSGWAVDGVEPTLRALARGQVRTLIADHDAEVAGFRLALSGRLTSDRAGSRADGEPLPVADVIDDAIEDALRQRSRVAVVRGDLSHRFHQLAAVLRFRAAR
jgi:peptide chain release factor subunit 1